VVVHHEQVGLGEDRNRRQIAQRIVRELAVERHVDRHRGGVDQQRVAVGRGLRDQLVGDVGAGPRSVLDDHRLAEELGELRREQPRVDVDAAAGRETDDEPDRLERIGLRKAAPRRAAATIHRLPLS
jgi:hypothetical protein